MLFRSVENLGAWEDATRLDDSVLVWDTDDAGPVTVDGKEVGLFVHFDENTQMYDWACTYEL